MKVELQNTRGLPLSVEADDVVRMYPYHDPFHKDAEIDLAAGSTGGIIVLGMRDGSEIPVLMDGTIIKHRILRARSDAIATGKINAV